MKNYVTLVLGGVSSGKSAFAEGLADQQGNSKLYIATAEVRDGEMRRKVDAHRDRRGSDWRTVEAPINVLAPLSAPAEDVVLLDCVSMWLTNHLLANSDLDVEGDAFLSSLETGSKPVILVSNEVGLGGIEVNSLARRFASEQGQINQKLAALADKVYLVTAGIPILIKGSSDG